MSHIYFASQIFSLLYEKYLQCNKTSTRRIKFVNSPIEWMFKNLSISNRNHSKQMNRIETLNSFSVSLLFKHFIDEHVNIIQSRQKEGKAFCWNPIWMNIIQTIWIEKSSDMPPLNSVMNWQNYKLFLKKFNDEWFRSIYGTAIFALPSSKVFPLGGNSPQGITKPLLSEKLIDLIIKKSYSYNLCSDLDKEIKKTELWIRLLPIKLQKIESFFFVNEKIYDHLVRGFITSKARIKIPRNEIKVSVWKPSLVFSSLWWQTLQMQ